jgi:hypothetical protein
MWYEELPIDHPWSALWYGYTICGHCRGIRGSEIACRACGGSPPSFEPQMVRFEGGREEKVVFTEMGAEGRYEDYVYLNMIEREWKRPVLDADRFPGFSSDGGPSPRASIVLLFWSYFETRIERLLRAGLREVPERLLDDALRRYSAIGARMNDFYRIAFASTYREDLEEVGHGQVWPHLAKIQERRNLFAHGQPQAIDDVLVQATVEMMKVEHEAWIAVFNKRAARPPTHLG